MLHFWWHCTGHLDVLFLGNEYCRKRCVWHATISHIYQQIAKWNEKCAYGHLLSFNFKRKYREMGSEDTPVQNRGGMPQGFPISCCYRHSVITPSLLISHDRQHASFPSHYISWVCLPMSIESRVLSNYPHPLSLFSSRLNLSSIVVFLISRSSYQVL